MLGRCDVWLYSKERTKVLEVDTNKAIVVRRLFELRHFVSIGHLLNWQKD